MMMVPHSVLPSAVHGLGVFATKIIYKNDLIWRYQNPPDYRLTEIEILSKGGEWYAFRIIYGYKPKGEDYVEFPGDAALFMNHSANPNCIYISKTDMIASCKIMPGEEILADYFEFDEEPESGGRLT